MRVSSTGFRSRFAVALSGLMALVLGGIAYRIYMKERELLDESLRRRGTQVVSVLARFLVEPLFHQDHEQVQKITEELKEDGVYAIVIDQSGHYLAHTQRELRNRELTDPYAKEIVRRYELGGPAASWPVIQDVYDEERRGIRKYREFARPIVLGRQLVGFVRVGFETRREVERPLEENQKALAALFLPALIAGIVLAVLLANLIIRPVQALVNEAREMARGHYDRIVKLPGPFEIQVLSESFNHMRSRIQEHVQEIAQANAKLDRRIFELGVLYDVARAMNFKSYSPELLDYLLDTTGRALESEWASLMLADEQTGHLVVTTVRGMPFDRHRSPELHIGQGIAGLAFERREPVVANEGSRDPRFSHLDGQESFETTIRQIACAPLLVENCPIGVLNVCNKRGAGGFHEDDARLLMALASQAARALESAKLYDQAIRESKTGLYVPSYFEARVQEQITASRRFGQEFSLLMLDVDHFKKVNDTWGHLCGDEVLIKIARFIKETLREGIDVASRFGGEEFSLLLPRTDREGAYAFAERLRQRIEREVGSADLGPERVTVSVGIAVFPRHAEELEELKKKADDSLYQAKRRGRNQVCAAD